jgi:hypothetical protein
MVAGLVLASGYFYPSLRGDVVILSGPSFPLVGDFMSHTISPILARMMRPLFMRKIFSPAPIPKKFANFPKEMAFRPSQIRASAAETALMIPDAFASCKDYSDLKMPLVIIAGDQDKLIDINSQSARLHREVAKSTLPPGRERPRLPRNGRGRWRGECPFVRGPYGSSRPGPHASKRSRAGVRCSRSQADQRR